MRDSVFDGRERVGPGHWCTQPEAIIVAACATAGAIRVSGEGGKAARRYDDPLPPSEAGRRRQDPVADLDALHPRPYRENPAGALVTLRAPLVRIFVDSALRHVWTAGVVILDIA